jgi:hypothetical protein
LVGGSRTHFLGSRGGRGKENWEVALFWSHVFLPTCLVFIYFRSKGNVQKKHQKTFFLVGTWYFTRKTRKLDFLSIFSPQGQGTPAFTSGKKSTFKRFSLECN